MKKGETVPVYNDPDEQTSLEGYARTVEKTFENDFVEFWIVRFKGSGREGQRIFYKKRDKKVQIKRQSFRPLNSKELNDAYTILARLYGKKEVS
jgi:hypothetical protein